MVLLIATFHSLLAEEFVIYSDDCVEYFVNSFFFLFLMATMFHFYDG